MDPDAHPAGGEQALTREPETTDVVAICGWLNEVGAKYVLVGGLAIVLQGYPRFTADIDLLIKVDRENVKGVAPATGSATPHQVEVCRHPPNPTRGG
jgi:hypothetical protein